MDTTAPRFPGLDEVLCDNIGNMEDVVERFDELVEDIGLDVIREEITTYRDDLVRFRNKMVLEILVDNEVDLDSRVYSTPDDPIKAAVLGINNRIKAVDSMLSTWLKDER